MEAHPYDVPERDPNPREIQVGEHSFRAWPGKPGGGMNTTPMDIAQLERLRTTEYQRGVRDATDYQLRQRRIEKTQYDLLQRDAKSASYHLGFKDGFANGRCITAERVIAGLVVGIILVVLWGLAWA